MARSENPIDRGPGKPDEAAGALPLGRRFLVPELALTAAEVLLVAWPLHALFQPTAGQSETMARVAAILFAAATLVWYLALAVWLSPVQRAWQRRRRGEWLADHVRDAACAAAFRLPLRALFGRTALWLAASAAHGLFLWQGAEWRLQQAGELAALAGIHSFTVSCGRAVWYAAILARVRAALFSDIAPIQHFAAGYFDRLVLVASVVFAGTLAGIGAFLYYFFPISLAQYLQVQGYFPAAVAAALILWTRVTRRSTRPLDRYLAAHKDDVGGREEADAAAIAVYRLAQALPYRLAVATIILWSLVAAAGAVTARVRLRFEYDDAVLLLGVAVVTAVGASIYEALWHRETMRPLLEHLALRHRIPVGRLRPTLSLRSKLLLSFGGVVVFACGLALFWGFVQYKSLATEFVFKQTSLGLAWLRSEVQAAAAASERRPAADIVRGVLRGIDQRHREANAVFYYLPSEPGAEMAAHGGGPMGAPELPWYAVAQMNLSWDDRIEIGSLNLAGHRGRLRVSWRGGDRYDLGSVAVLYPTYTGRGPSLVRPLKELMVFFFVLFGACSGIVLFTVWQFVQPIRRLERRADEMARGELAEPVNSGGEGDEVGSLTLALEKMRRALREKLRTTEEMNIDLERAVLRRTADLAKKNRELADALHKLTRAQDQLLRSEKMASIGQLVAGIAHEINNPVNAIVNTVGPLQEAIARILKDGRKEQGQAAAEIQEMVAVVKRGAGRTKDIVQALHNYSRTDDESVVEVDLNRSIDDSLELLRHMLKQNITVVRTYGKVGRMRGHAGQLNQVFVNLLANAAQALAGRDGATIWIETAEKDNTIVITMRDNGAGIREDVLPRIFDPFFTTKDVGEGTGLGLSIVHGIVERHGGSIEVESRLGEGTSFCIRLPRDGSDSIAA